MNIPSLSIKKPIFITSIVLLMLFAGWQSLSTMPVDLYPKAEIPYITVSTVYPGAGPREIENAITKPIEDELTALEGLKKVTSTSQDSISIVTAQFRDGMPLDTLEQRLREKVALAKAKFPRGIEEPIVERLNVANTPIISIFVESEKMKRPELTNWIDHELKPSLIQIPKVGRVDVLGGTKREIQIEIDPIKMANYRIPLLGISSSLENGGQNIPGGSLKSGDKEINVRSMADYSNLSDIENKLISFNNLESGIRIKDMGKVIDGHEKQKSMAFYNGKEGIIVQIFKQSDANTTSVADRIKKDVTKINAEIAKKSDVKISVVRDGSRLITDSVSDVWETIVIGIILTIIVVYFFLGSFRSTLITGFAIPNSLLGAFVLMGIFGFSINILTLLALSLAVGLLVDDAIVVRENIFKHMERGKPAKEAAVDGANEVAMAVVAVTAAVLSMFGPVGFLKGTIGQFFREFGLTISFAMIISLFDAMAVAPMLSAYWGGVHEHATADSKNPFRRLVYWFDRFQSWLEKVYHLILNKLLRFPFITTTAVVTIAIALTMTATLLPSSFSPVDQNSDFSVNIKLPVGTSLEASGKFANEVDTFLKKLAPIDYTVLTVGNAYQEAHVSDIYVRLKSKEFRKGSRPSEIRDMLRNKFSTNQEFKKAVITLNSTDNEGGAFKPFTLLVQSNNPDELPVISQKVFDEVKKIKSIVGPVLELKPGSKEIQVEMRLSEAQKLGVSPTIAGNEVRARIEGVEVGKFRQNGKEFDIKLTTNDPAKLWLNRDKEILVPNINLIPVDLRKVADFKEVQGQAKLDRVNRTNIVRISADIGQEGLTTALEATNKSLETLKKSYPDLRWTFEGDAESYEEMSQSTGRALLFGIVLLFLVLASLYESFLLSALNIVSLPLAVSGAFVALWLAKDGLHMYSMIGMLLLLGVAAKNSILLVDTAKERMDKGDGQSLEEISYEIASASVRRLRPILMTSLALIAGTIPIAIGLNEASSQRTGMGIAIIGGAITSTLFTLIFIPSLLILVEKVKMKLKKFKN